MVTAEDAGYYKPRPEPYRMILPKLGTKAERTLFVAGSAFDVPGAAGTGMPVYWHNRMRLPLPGGAKVTPVLIAESLWPLVDFV